jgi:hypothetical protein
MIKLTNKVEEPKNEKEFRGRSTWRGKHKTRTTEDLHVLA